MISYLATEKDRASTVKKNPGFVAKQEPASDAEDDEEGYDAGEGDSNPPRKKNTKKKVRDASGVDLHMSLYMCESPGVQLGNMVLETCKAMLHELPEALVSDDHALARFVSNINTVIVAVQQRCPEHADLQRCLDLISSTRSIC